MFGREKLAQAAKELADHLLVVESIKALQTAQKELADAIKKLDQRIRRIENDLQVIKAETKLDALRETQSVINAVQGGLNQRIEDLAVKIAVMQSESKKAVPLGSPTILELKHADRGTTSGDGPSD